MGTIELNATQRGRAKQLKNRLNAGKVRKPQDINRVRPWGSTSLRAMNEKREYDVFEPENTQNKTGWVNPDNIAGVCGSPNPNKHSPQKERLEKKRLHRILDQLLEDKFDVKYSEPPQYLEFDGKYYVGADGTHRSIACKAVNVDQIWADITVV